MGCGISNKVSIRKSVVHSSTKLKNIPEQFVTSNEKKFIDVYKVGPTLGSGAFGEVKIVVHKVTGQERAAKIFRKDLNSAASLKLIKNEIEILRRLSHPTVIKMYEFFEDDRRVYMVLEKCDGGELFDYVSNKKSLNESISALICKQIFSAVSYLHDNNIAHRDIKPENILLEDSDDFINIKLIDFGTAIHFEPNTYLKGLTGSTYYLSPEVLSGVYDESCDLWSCGVILYILLSGMPPFPGNSDSQIMERIQLGKYSLDEGIWKSVSDPAKDLIRKLLCPVTIRLTATEALQHPWILANGNYPQPSSETVSEVLGNLKVFQSINKFRDAISTFITSQVISLHETKELREIFKAIDTNGDGKLSKDEMLTGFSCYNETDSRDGYIDKIMREVDTDGNGYIDYNEFIKATLSEKALYSRENIKKTFDMFDLDGSSKISSAELQQIFSVGNVQDSLWQTVVAQADKNFDGEIDFDEFFEFLNALSSHKQEFLSMR